MKRIYILIVLSLITFTLFSQNTVFPKFDWHGETKTENVYVALLGLKDKNALIVKIGYSSYWTEGMVSKFIVFQNDGKVKHFEVFQPRDSKKKIKVKRKRIKRKAFPYYWNYLNYCFDKQKFKIDKSQLNITEKINRKDGTVQMMSISDGTTYHFWICQGKKYIAYGSYAPEVFIRNDFPGAKERQKLVDIMNGFEKIIKK
jgi:hypothetical protein